MKRAKLKVEGFEGRRTASRRPAGVAAAGVGRPAGEAAAGRKAYGGKTVYGARVGILILDTRFPRIPGDPVNAGTWPFPVLYKVVRGASPQQAVSKDVDSLLPAFLEAADEVVADGADGITTTCGFLALFQKELAAHCQVPVATSSLMQVPAVERLLPPGKRAGIVTVLAPALTREHLEAAGAAPDTPVVGTEGGREFTRAMHEGELEVDVAACEADVLDAGEQLVRRHPEVGAVVVECTRMVPFSRALRDHLGLPVYDIYSFVTWFHAGLAPRDFGWPGSGPRDWRQR